MNNKPSSKIFSAQASDKARRPNNEDAVAFFEPTDPQELSKSGRIYIVADGVGGAVGGERASRYAADKVLFEYLKHPSADPRERLQDVIPRVSRAIFEYAEDNHIRMATTITIAVVLGGHLYAANVGDSRVYLIRGPDVQQITRDHSYVGEMVRDGRMTEAQAMASKIKNKLTRSVGGQRDVTVDVFGPIPLQPDDKILLCSDGLTRYALKEDLSKMTMRGSPTEIVKTLIEFAKHRGGADNVSAVVAYYEPTAAFEPAVAPTEQPVIHDLDIRETAPVVAQKPPEPERKRPSWAFWAVGAGTSIVLLGAIALFLVWKYLPINWRTTSTPTAIIPPAATSTITPLALSATDTPTSTATATQLTPKNGLSPIAPTAMPPESLPPGATVGTVERCPAVSVRPKPIRDDELARPIGKIECYKTVIITGQYNKLSDPTEFWYQIDYTDEYGSRHIAWVFGPNISVPADAVIPQLDFDGNPLIP